MNGRAIAEMGYECVATRAGVVASILYEAAWAIVLHRYMREPTVSFASGDRWISVNLSAETSIDELLRAIEVIQPQTHGHMPAAAEHPLSQSRLLASDSATRTSASLRFVLEQLADDRRSMVHEIDILPEDERRKILVDWNATARPAPENCLLHELFEARADSQPEAIAFEFAGVSVTYAELEARANRLAHALRGRDALPGTFVGVCLERGIDLVVALLAVAKSGAAYLPLDPREPAPRLSSMLSDAGAALVVTRQRLFSTPSATVAILDVDADELGGLPTSRPPRIANTSQPCYAIFTSGSTGRPNGVVLSHRAVVNTLDWVNRTFEVGPGDRLLFVTSPCFDLSVYDLFGALGAGATVVVVSDAELTDPAALTRYLADERITIWNSAPAALQRLTADWQTPFRESSLRLVLLSGDWIPLTLPAAARRAFPEARVVSLGGATEAAIWSNWFPIEDIDPRWTSIPYGRPIQNARYYALDERMQPVPVGVIGDLYIGGACLADGYLNRPQLTAERFLADPFTGDGRLYKTGDLVRYFADGNLEFLGRSDFQVKIRGFRVELGEIEAALLAMPQVAQAVCIAETEAPFETTATAYIVLTPGHPPDERLIRRALGASLPPQLVPTRIAFIRALPLSSNGKVDRRALPNAPRLVGARAYVAPRNQREHDMVRLWEKILEHSPIGVTDDFFELGGNSISALIAVSNCRTELGLHISLARFLERPTIEGVLQSLDDESHTTRGSPRAATQRSTSERPPLVLITSGPYALLHREFGKLFGPDQPLQLLHVPHVEDDSPEAVAVRCETEVTAAHPAGALVVGAFGSNAAVAFALTRRLHAQKREVPLVVLIDGAVRKRGLDMLRDRVRSTARRAARLLFGVAATSLIDTRLLMICSHESTPLARRLTAADATHLVARPVSVLDIPGQHMTFLASAGCHGVLDAIRKQIDQVIDESTHARKR